MARAVLGFNEQLERLGEFAVVLVIGALLATVETVTTGVWLALVLFVVIRPAATLLALVGQPLSGLQRTFIAWFGVRGVGSFYYLTYAITHGLAGAEARVVADATVLVVAASILLHGVSVTPLMRRYSAQQPENRERSEG
jgi:NhaP-type Na+/H+ or K+/H+ antiporter